MPNISMSNIKLTTKSDFYLKTFISNISTRNWIRNILVHILSLKGLIFRRINYSFLHSWKYILYSIFPFWNNSSNQIFLIVSSHRLHLLLSRIKSNMKSKISSIPRFYANVYSILSSGKITQFRTIYRNLSIISSISRNWFKISILNIRINLQYLCLSFLQT